MPSSPQTPAARPPERRAERRAGRRAERRPERRPLRRGDLDSWMWAAHRITGVMVFAFVVVFALQMSLLAASPETFNRVARVFQNPVVTVLEVVLVGGVLFHALNGLRVLLLDGWSGGARRRVQLRWTVLTLWVVLFLPAAYLMLGRTLTLLFGQLP